HTATAVHDTGHQMMQTGRLFSGGIEHPHAGCVVSYLKGQRGEVPAHVLLPRPIGRTGGNLPHGQNAGYLGKQYDPFILNADPSDPKFKVPDLLPPEYISAIRAERRQKMRDAVEGSLRAFEQNAQAKQLDDNFGLAYRLMSSPQARQAFALDKEPAAVRDRYGRTPKINPAGGRDHHPGVWTILLGGGPIKGGRIVGESDELGYSPKTRPVTPGEVAATIYQALGLDVHKDLPGPQNRPLPLVDY